MQRRPSEKPDMFARRTFLQGTGAVIALPFLESLLPRAARAAALGAPPTRLISYFVPLGMLADDWVPKTTGPGYALSPTLQPLAGYVNDFTVVTNTNGYLDNQPRAESGGAHAIGCALYPTSTRIAPPGPAVLATSFDQVVAQSIGGATRLQSMQLGVLDDNPWADGFNTSYMHSISWSSATTPLPAEKSPLAAFNRLFPAGTVVGQNASRLARVAARVSTPASLQKSILDAAIAQTSSLKLRLGTADRQILDQYLTNLRAVEKTLAVEPELSGDAGGTTPATGAGSTPSSAGGASSVASCRIPGAPAESNRSDYTTQIAQYTAMMPLALACDQTRVLAFAFGRGMSDRRYSHLGAPAGHHKISHWNLAESGLSQADNKAWLRKIQAYETKCFADLLAGLRAIPEGSGSLLDNTVLFFSSELSDSAGHKVENMPVLIAGGGGGRLKARGQHIRAPDGTKYAQALLTAVRATGVELDRFGSQNVSDPIAGML